MSIEISIRDLAQSQLLTLKGEALGDSSPTGGRDLFSSARADLKEHAARQQNRLIDNKYKIIGLLGVGGMGAVYKAHHLMLNKDVALKTFFSPNVTGNSWQRFQREAKAIASLSHKNIVQVFDFGVGEDNVPYYTMEYLQGESLCERLSRVGKLPLDQAVNLFLQVCQAMDAAHNKGIVHRDLKPANIFLSLEEGVTSKIETVKIVDFGIAALANESIDEQKLTRAGTVFGSPLYMSPEQSLGAEVTTRSDIYSCGCALFETLTGNPPFRGETAFATMLQHQQSPLPDLHATWAGQALPQRLKVLLTKMLAKHPHDRSQSMLEVSTELQAIARLCSHVSREGGAISDNPAGSDRERLEPGQTSFLSTKSVRSRAVAMVILVAGGSSLYWLEHRSAAGRTKSLNSTAPATAPSPVASEIRRARKDSLSAFPDLNAGNAVMEENVDVSAKGPLPVRQKYLQNPDAVSSSHRRFIFSGQQSFGRLFCQSIPGASGPVRTIEDKEAIGEVPIPPRCHLTLIAGPALAAHPELFAGFGVDDLWSLRLGENSDWTNQHLSYACKLSGLRCLDIEEVNVTDGCLQHVQKLPNLKELTVSRTEITGPGLANLKRLPQLTLIGASGLHSFKDALASLTKANQLVTLSASDCMLNDNDMKLISTMRSIVQLDVSQNNFTEAGLEEICKLPKLEVLTVDNTKITPACVTVLEKAKRLKKLLVTDLTTLDRLRLQLALPRFAVIHVANRRIYTGPLYNK